jgi:hypothetical protein
MARGLAACLLTVGLIGGFSGCGGKDEPPPPAPAEERERDPREIRLEALDWELKDLYVKHTTEVDPEERTRLEELIRPREEERRRLMHELKTEKEAARSGN